MPKSGKELLKSSTTRFIVVFFLLCIVPANPCPGAEDRPNQNDPLKKPPQATETTPQIRGIPSGPDTVTAREKEEGPGEKPNALAEKSMDKSGPEGTPLKEFVPSEKIKADQAVDFPSDI